MFANSNEKIDMQALSDFIEMPSQNSKEAELESGVNRVVIVLQKNPLAIMNIIANHAYLPAIFLLDDLADKLKRKNCLEKLETLFDHCMDELVHACIYNVFDLERCINIFPANLDKIMQVVFSQEDCVKRILAADKDPQATLKMIVEKYPNYAMKFSEYNDSHPVVVISRP